MWWLSVGTFLVSLILTYLWFRLQERKRFGQPIREYGPEIHIHKKGTPTAGGISLLVAFFGSWALLALYDRATLSAQALFVGAATLGFGLIGLLDDGLKILQRHAQGLPGRYKLLLQALVCTGLAWAALSVEILPSVRVPFSGAAFVLSPALGVGLIFLIFFSTVNAFNETDGLDGLLAGVTLLALGAYGVILSLQGEFALLQITLIATMAVLGFLWWNAHPAKIILGDTGSFALGGLVGALALVTGTALFLPLIALIPVIETLSVIVQVISFKLFKKRVFKVSPLHHHFERAKGVDYEFLLPNQEWPEVLITLRFWIVAVIGAVLGLLAYR
uniref:Phospho-N-acetylmuramoyl-pentapeptide-transferase n=2 Tax=Candidatus Bipolaricaulota TaxID=67810 RepID=H5SC68_9BACT|nr:phospho-N-acetylmuramoyl-pentapeptide-transferase [uncultured Acetothermia bacterium]BAL59452.1 phospho-N-acetylmuramoyl-pentapeptide-transferase [Candidatus Acetothermum autotrophicum]